MELIIFIGLQGTGKSTFYRTRFAATHACISKDQFRNNPHPGRRQRQLVVVNFNGEQIQPRKPIHTFQATLETPMPMRMGS